MPLVERISSHGKDLAIVFRAAEVTDKTTFLTPSDWPLQAGFVVHPGGHEIPRHTHRPIERKLTTTSEVICVARGRCAIDFYDSDRTLVTTRELGPGDVMVMFAGGHGFRMLEDTVLFEVKQGPYPGIDEKERF